MSIKEGLDHKRFTSFTYTYTYTTLDLNIGSENQTWKQVYMALANCEREQSRVATQSGYKDDKHLNVQDLLLKPDCQSHFAKTTHYITSQS